MAQNRGKQFEGVIRECFLQVPTVSLDRLHDRTDGFKGGSNICDFIVYKKPYEYYVECKSVHGNTLSIHSIPKPDKNGELHGFYGNITDTQYEGLLEKSKITGVKAGILCWWVDKDVTKWIPIQAIEYMRQKYKSIRFDVDVPYGCKDRMTDLKGRKKRIFFEYNMEAFFNEV